MANVKSKCPNCGEISEIESSEFNVVCFFCGVPYMPKEGIDNFNNHIARSIDIDTVNVHSENIKNYAMLGLSSLKEKNAEKCGFYADDILKRNPSSPEGLLLKAYFVSNNYSKEDGIKYFFQAINNCEDKNLLKTIFNAFNECILDYSIDNFSFLFEKILFEGVNKFFSLFQYSLSVFFNKYDSLEAKFELFNVTLNDYQNCKLLSQFDDIKVVSNKESNILLVNNSLLLLVKNDVIVSAISLSDITNKEVGKYYNKSQENKYSYYFYIGETNMIEFTFINENKELEQFLNDKGFTVELVKGGCYVATCVYGSYSTQEVFTLRRFRDKALKSNIFGRIFVKLYYFISPLLVKLFGKTKWFNKINKKILDRFVTYLQDKGYDNTPYYGD